MRRSLELLVVVLVAAAGVARAEPTDTVAPDAAAAKPADAKPADAKPDAKPGGFLGLGHSRSKDPITITSDNLEYQYNDGVIVYRGEVLAVQGEVKVRSNELRITLMRDDKKSGGARAASELGSADTSKLQSVVASGSVRIDQGTRWAVGGKATFDQSNRTLVLTENPVLHEGPNEIVGDRVVVYLDEDRSVVEGGRKRVKAVLFPGKDGAGKEPANGAKPAKPPATADATPPGTAR
jgi:lipopolysaccharide export system protein LptA